MAEQYDPDPPASKDGSKSETGSVRHVKVEVPDAELVARTLEGDRWAEEVIFRRHVHAVSGLVTRLLGSRTDAQDIVQDTFIAAFEGLPGLREPARLRSWILRIAVHRVRKRIRRQRLRRALGMETPVDATLETYVEAGASSEERAEIALLDDFLRRLPPEQRLAWLLRYVEGHRLEEVAELCDCSLATAKRRIAAAHRKVRAHCLSVGRDGQPDTKEGP